MPSALSYPGVYIEEIPSGVRTITGVAMSIAAFVDWFPRGVLNEAVQCLSYADFEREFRGIDVNSPASYGIKPFISRTVAASAGWCGWRATELFRGQRRRQRLRSRPPKARAL